MKMKTMIRSWKSRFRKWILGKLGATELNRRAGAWFELEGVRAIGLIDGDHIVFDILSSGVATGFWFNLGTHRVNCGLIPMKHMGLVTNGDQFRVDLASFHRRLAKSLRVFTILEKESNAQNEDFHPAPTTP